MKWIGSGEDDFDLSGLLPEHDPERTKKDHRTTNSQVRSRDEPASSEAGYVRLIITIVIIIIIIHSSLVDRLICIICA